VNERRVAWAFVAVQVVILGGLADVALSALWLRGALTARRASIAALGFGVAAIVFFSVKARWEERHLRRSYPGYAADAARTGRILPRFR